MFINKYGPMTGWGGIVNLVRHNFNIVPPAEYNFEHNTFVSQVTPESIILYFSNIIRQTLGTFIDPCTLDIIVTKFVFLWKGSGSGLAIKDYSVHGT